MDSRGADSRGNGEYGFDGIDRQTDLEEGDAGAGGETEVAAAEATGCGGGGGEGVNMYGQILHTTYMYEEQSGMRKMYRHSDRIPSWHLYAVLLSY